MANDHLPSGRVGSSSNDELTGPSVYLIGGHALLGRLTSNLERLRCQATSPSHPRNSILNFNHHPRAQQEEKLIVCQCWVPLTVSTIDDWLSVFKICLRLEWQYIRNTKAKGQEA